jgi:hypothetical protein
MYFPKVGTVFQVGYKYYQSIQLDESEQIRQLCDCSSCDIYESKGESVTCTGMGCRQGVVFKEISANEAHKHTIYNTDGSEEFRPQIEKPEFEVVEPLDLSINGIQTNYTSLTWDDTKHNIELQLSPEQIKRFVLQYLSNNL